MRRLVKHLQVFLRWLIFKPTRPPSWTESAIISAPESRIEDGVDYRRPLVVPSDIQQQGQEAVKRYLMESEQLYRGPFDMPYRSAADMPMVPITDDPLREWDYQTRGYVLTNCHAAYQRNPVAKRAVNVTRQFAVGKGHTVKTQNTKVQEIIDAFRENPENNIMEYERTFLQDLIVDGELFIRFVAENGETLIIPTPPWYVRWIVTDPGFFRRVTAYKLEYNNPQGDEYGSYGEYVRMEVKPEDMLHVPINNHSYELRGRPDLYAILPWLKAYKDWLEDRYRQNKWRGALLWGVKIIGAAAGVIGAKVAQYRKPPTPGSIVVHSEKEEWSVMSNPVAANDASEDGRQFRMMAATGMDLPEFMLGDGENANLATATAQQLPSLWKFTDAQEIMKERVWTPIYKRVIQNAIDAKLLTETVTVEDSDGDPILDTNGEQQTVDAVKAFSVSYYDLLASDPKTLAEALAVSVSNEWCSNETAAERMDFDWQLEKKRIANEKEQKRSESAQGKEITPADLGVDPNADPNAPQQQGGQGAQQVPGENGTGQPGVAQQKAPVKA